LDDNTNTDKSEPTPMAKTKMKPAAAPPKNRLTVNVHVEKGEDVDRAIGRTYLSPEVNAGLNMSAWNGELSVDGIRRALSEQINEVAGGCMSRPEAMLLPQAHVLDSLFNVLAAKAQNQTYIPNLETFLRLALKAQAQCRATIQTLSDVKNPSVVYARQANFSGGHQQINNNVPGQATTHAEKSEKLQNELLLEEAHYAGTTLDTGATGTAIPVNSHLEALEKSRG